MHCWRGYKARRQVLRIRGEIGRIIEAVMGLTEEEGEVSYREELPV